MKYLKWTLVIVGGGAFLGVGIYLFCWSIVAGANSLQAENAKRAPVCTRWASTYYWIGWEGTQHDTGQTDPAKAHEVAGDRPLTIPHRCEEWQNN